MVKQACVAVSSMGNYSESSAEACVLMASPFPRTFMFLLIGVNLALLGCVLALAWSGVSLRPERDSGFASEPTRTVPSATTLNRGPGSNERSFVNTPTRAARDLPTESVGMAENEPSGSAVRVESFRELRDQEAATIKLFQDASPSVVHITTARVARDMFSMDVQKIPQGSGTGFVWDDRGHIVTNFHVIRSADVAMVAFDDQKTYSAKLVGAAEDKDLAVLKIEAPPEQLKPLRRGVSSDLQVGRMTFAIGNPFGLDQTLTTGVVSALGREIKSEAGVPIKDVIQTDAAINPGNSGGPLLDRSGQLIGVNTAIFSPSGAYAGIGFAIPVDTVRWVVPELIEHGKLIRPGMAITVASDTLLKRWRLPEGLLVLGVNEGSRAEEAGLRPTRRTNRGIVLGDIIVAIDQQPVKKTSDLLLILENYSAGDVVRLTLLRDGRSVLVPITLELLEG